MTEIESNDVHSRLGAVLIQLFKGVLYRDRHEHLWQALLDQQGAVRDYVEVIGLDLLLDEGEGYSFLRQCDTDADEDDLEFNLEELLEAFWLGFLETYTG